MHASASFVRCISAGILAAFLATGPAFAVQIDVAFDAGGDMASWSEAANWDPDVVPDNAADTYAVSIDQGGSFDVQLDVTVIVDSLSVGSDDTLTFGNGRDLTLVNGGLSNENLIQLDSTGGLTDLNLENGAAIAGSGTIALSNSGNNRIRSDATTITHGSGHTISGAGQLLGNMLNQGTILADQATALSIDPGALGFTNQGTMQATGAGGFVFGAGVFTNTGQTIDVQDGSRLDLIGSTVSGGTLQTTGAGAVNLIGGTRRTLNDITLEATVVQGNNADTDITGSFTNNGTWTVNSTGAQTDITFDGTTIDGTGTIDLGDRSTNFLRTTGTLVTNGPNHTLEGAGRFVLGTGGMVNEGTIRADETTAMRIDAGDLGFTNQGTMQATGAGGFVFGQGVFTNTGRTIDIQDGSQLELLAGTTVSGGTLQTTGTGAVNLTGVGVTLDDMTLEATVVQGRDADTNITGSFTNNGNWTVDSSGANTSLSFDGTTINGTGTIELNALSNDVILTGNTLLTHGVNHTIEGTGRIAGNVINDGTILADQTTALRIEPGALGFTNQGTMQATGAGGFVFAGGEFTNSGQTIDVQDGSQLELLAGATVSGGTLQTTGTGAVNLTGTGVGLNDITLEATVVQGDDADTNVTGSFTNNGTWTVNSPSAQTSISFDGTTINGSGTIDLGDQSDDRISSGASTLLTHGANHTIQGAGQVLTNAGGMINNGTILATETTAMRIDPGSLGFDNRGTLRAVGAGGFDIVETAGDFTTSGLVEIESGSRIDVLGSGVYEQTGGTTTVQGTLSAGLRVDIEGGRLQGGGVVEGDVFNLTGGIVGPGTSPDTLTLTDDYDQDAFSRFEVEIFGFLQGTEFDFLDVGGEAFLDGFLDVILDPDFGRTLAIGDSFVILEAAGGVTGMFASLDVSLAGLEFEQIVNPFDVTLRVTQAVPEPGTLVLVVAGLFALVSTRRRI